MSWKKFMTHDTAAWLSFTLEGTPKLLTDLMLYNLKSITIDYSDHFWRVLEETIEDTYILEGVVQ